MNHKNTLSDYGAKRLIEAKVELARSEKLVRETLTYLGVTIEEIRCSGKVN